MAGRAFAIALLVGCYHPTATSIPLEPEPVKPTAVTTWDLDEAAAISYALAHSPLLAERGDVERVADAGITAARTIEDPELRIGRTSEDELLGTSQKLGVALRIKPPAPWTIDARLSRARAERDAERAITRATARTLTFEIQELYADLAFGEAAAAMLRRETEVRRERDRVIAERAERGTATQIEALLASSDRISLETSTSEIERDLVRTRSKLTSLLGIPDGQTWTPVARLDMPEVDAAGLAERAVAEDPVMRELAARSTAAGAELYEEKTKRLPSLSWIQVERSTDATDTAWSIGAALAIPLTGLVGGKVDLARAEQRRYQHARERRAAAILASLREAVVVVDATRTHLTALTQRLAPLDEQITALLAQERTANGDPIKILLLEERQLKNKRDVLEAHYAHRRAVIELSRVVGP